MRKKDVIQMLHDVDEETAVTIGEQYSGIPDAENERIFQRIRQNLQTQENMQEERFAIGQVSRFAWVRHASAAAACLLVLCGTFAGLHAMKKHMPLPEQEEPTEHTEDTSILVHAIGESYKAENLTKNGTLILTVADAEMTQEGLYHVGITLKSEDAVSRAPDQPNVFMADNFMLAVGQDGSFWKTVQPCGIKADGKQNVDPYMLTLHSGETRVLELWYRIDSEPSECRLVTSYSTEYPYTELIDKEK